MTPEIAKLFGKNEARKLRTAAELYFFQCLKNGKNAVANGTLPGEIEGQIARCLHSGFAENDIDTILHQAWRMAQERRIARRKVFVVASLTHGRLALPYVKFALRFLGERGCEILSEHNGADHPVKKFLEKVNAPAAQGPDLHNIFRDNDNRWVRECGLLVAELSEPSLGVGGEWENCRLKPELGSFLTPMLGVYLADKKVSPYVTGVTEEEKSYIWFRPYLTEEDLTSILSEFL